MCAFLMYTTALGSPKARVHLALIVSISMLHSHHLLHLYDVLSLIKALDLEASCVHP